MIAFLASNMEDLPAIDGDLPPVYGFHSGLILWLKICRSVPWKCEGEPAKVGMYGLPKWWLVKHKQITNIQINGHFRNLNWRYLPYIRPIFEAYVREYPTKIWPEKWY